MSAKAPRLLHFVLAIAICAPAAWAQANTTRVDGRITDAGKSLAGAQVILSQQDTLNVYRAATDKYGTFSIPDVPRGTYIVSILNASGDKVFRNTLVLTSESDAPIRLDLDISGAPANTPAPLPASHAPEAAAPNPQSDHDARLNSLIGQYNSALRANDRKAAITALLAVVAFDPTLWEYFEALCSAQMDAGDYENTAQSCEKGAQAAQKFIDGSPATDQIARSDRDRAKAAMSQMLLNQANAFLKLKKNKEAIAAYNRAAETSPDPATAWFNLCVLHYNSGIMDGALAACDKAIAANPAKADAYFIKASLLLTASPRDKDGKVNAPQGTIEALKKYLELAPQGPRADAVRQMLQYLGVKVTPASRPQTP